jgi:cytochrome P450
VLEEFLFRHLPAARASEGAGLFSVLCQVRDDDGTSFTDRDVVNHMIFLLMAAHDTARPRSLTSLDSTNINLVAAAVLHADENR